MASLKYTVGGVWRRLPAGGLSIDTRAVIVVPAAAQVLGLRGPAVLAGFLVASLLLAAAAYEWFERPVERWLRGLPVGQRDRRPA